MFLRRGAAVLASAALMGAGGALGAPAALAASSSSDAKLPSAMYGSADPQYDGVYRQSLALLAQDAVGVVPAKKAVGWLASQQCDGGSFTAYRADPGEPCGSGSAEDAADTNATGMAVQALARLGGHGETVSSSVSWLKSVQNKDGGWGYNPGGDSDANSTALVVGALVAAGEKPADVTSKTGGKSPYDALRSLQLGCEADAGERGAFAYLPDKGELAANDAATVAATLAAGGSGLATVAANEYEKADDGDAKDVEPPACRDGEQYAQKDAARAASAYLSGVLKKNKGFLPSVAPGAGDQPDHGSTALAALALAATGEPGAAARPLGWLEENLGSWDGLGESPAALGQLVLAVHAFGADPTDFGGSDLVEQLNATGPEPEQAEPKGSGDGDADGEDSMLVLWVVGIALVASIGLGMLLSMRKGGKTS